jgi:hypothetical protein
MRKSLEFTHCGFSHYYIGFLAVSLIYHPYFPLVVPQISWHQKKSLFYDPVVHF